MKEINGLNTSEAAKYIGLSRRTLQRLLDDRQIPYRQVNKRRIIAKHVLDRWLEGGDAKDEQK
jgi:excisionase family DNA binding protein